MEDLSRRELMHSIAATGSLVIAGSMMPLSAALAEQGTRTATRGPQPKGVAIKRSPASLMNGRVVQPQRELAILRKTNVLVIGGGPAGTAAALAAKRLGVDVTLVERYGYLGGLATGGLVLAIFPLYDRKNRQVILGIGEEMMKRLESLNLGSSSAARPPYTRRSMRRPLNMSLRIWF